MGVVHWVGNQSKKARCVISDCRSTQSASLTTGTLRKRPQQPFEVLHRVMLVCQSASVGIRLATSCKQVHLQAFFEQLYHHHASAYPISTEVHIGVVVGQEVEEVAF